MGGAPCQSFSVFGQRKGMDDPRGTLLWDYLRVIREVEPTCFIFENVAGLLTIDDGKVFKQFLDELSKDADGNTTYKTSHYLLDTASFGVPQYRSRVIVFGTKDKEISCPIKTHAETMAKYFVLADNENLFASKYMPYLPTEEELRRELERERERELLERKME